MDHAIAGRAGMSLPARRRAAELMDHPEVDPAQLEHGLADLRWVNRWLGGTRSVLRELAPLLRAGRGEEVRVLDVATGSADIPLALVRWARAAGVPVRVAATDFHPRTVAAARERAAAYPEVQVEQADALRLPYPDGAFDVSMCNTALHHFDDREAVAVLRELRRVARRGVVVTDLRRSRPALLGARLLASTLWRAHPVTRHDGPHSVRAAFTPAELTRLARQAGLEHARVRTRPLFRLALVDASRSAK
jgi:ubiquinone/menaquinone biosynthesis C-methylase UbiE